jgi:hypothetical protein
MRHEEAPMIRRFAIVMAAALLLQGTVFALYYGDLLYLRQPPDEIASGSVEAFRAHAESALGRDRLTVRHLDTIAEAAQAFGLHDVEVLALDRRTRIPAADRSAHLRLADALRRADRFEDAERIYLGILDGPGVP